MPASPGGSGDDGRGTGGAGAGASGSGGDTAQGGNGGSSGTGGSSASQSTGGAGGSAAGSGGRGGTAGSGTNTGGSTGQGGGTGGASPAGTGGSNAGTGGAAANPDAASMDPPDLGSMPLMECPGGSIDRFQKWLAHTLIVGSGGDASTLVKEGDRYVSKARFQGGDWSELVVQLANSASGMTDLTGSAGFSITYSATAPMWIELRGMVKPHGSEQYVVQLPATGGMTTTKFVPLTPDAWTFLPDLGKPTHSFADTLKTAYIFDIIGRTANTVTFSGLRFDKYVPTCR